MEITGARHGGVLFHITSLKTRHGIGDLGESAFGFARRLASTGMDLWQILPLGPTGYGNSPYAPMSSFAGNELMISLDKLAGEGLLSEEEISNPPEFDPDRVEFDKVRGYKLPLLKKAAARFLEKRGGSEAYKAFKEAQALWLDDYAVFMTLYEKYNDARWRKWDEKYSPGTLEKKKEEAEIWRAMQYFFDLQWRELRNYANSLGLKIIGDIPIFVGGDSADTWSHVELFKTDAKGEWSAVSGVPPDNFSATGQRWGNPVYDWKRHEATGFEWWIGRVRRQLELIDILRIDHFRGFDAYWEVKASLPTAEFGKWVKAPGKKFFKALEKELGKLPIIAEDLGFMTDSVNELRKSNGLPGMKIFQFGFTRLPDGSLNTWDTFLPHNWEEDFVAYPGTHDNETTRGWYDNLDPGMKHLVREYLGSNDEEIVWKLLTALFLSHAGWAIAPLQDVLEKGNEARMNTPSTCGDFNWSWKVGVEEFDLMRQARLRHLVKISGRDGKTFAERMASIEA